MVTYTNNPRVWEADFCEFMVSPVCLDGEFQDRQSYIAENLSQKHQRNNNNKTTTKSKPCSLLVHAEWAWNNPYMEIYLKIYKIKTRTKPLI